MPLPSGFTAVKDATAVGTSVNMIGIIVSIKGQKKTKGTNWVLEFTIQDDFSTGSIGSASSINCRIFRPSPDRFPKISAVGDVALIRNFRLDAWQGRIDCVCVDSLRSGLLVFPASGIPVPELSQAYQLGNQYLPCSAMQGTKDPNAQEQMAVIHLKHAASGSVQQVKQYAATTSFKAAAPDKLSLIKDLDFNRFYDVRAQVVNSYYDNFGTVNLKVTDYTSNKDLFLYAEPDDEDYAYQKMGWKGPYGQLTLDVRLYGNNAAWARDNISNGDFVFLRNLRTKISPANKLEGALHEDRQNPDQVDIRRLINRSDIDEINKRMKACEEQRSKKSAFKELQNVPKKPSAKASAKKKAEKRERQKQQKEQEQKEIAENAEKWEASRSGVNLNIRAAFPEVQLSTISEIIYNTHLKTQTPKYNDFTFPFLNCKHRTRVRVVDFFPPELELFVHCTNDPSWGKRQKKQDAGNGQAKDRWEWGFVLLLEDAKVPPNTVSEKLRVVIGNEAGQHLLDMNARDLKKDTRALKLLEEKLFILWGNLLELKTELRDRGMDLPLPPGDNRLQNKPFDCCIEEYGHEVPVTDKNPEGYQRMHRLAGTRIMNDV